MQEHSRFKILLLLLLLSATRRAASSRSAAREIRSAASSVCAGSCWQCWAAVTRGHGKKQQEAARTHLPLTVTVARNHHWPHEGPQRARAPPQRQPCGTLEGER